MSSSSSSSSSSCLARCMFLTPTELDQILAAGGQLLGGPFPTEQECLINCCGGGSSSDSSVTLIDNACCPEGIPSTLTFTIVSVTWGGSCDPTGQQYTLTWNPVFEGWHYVENSPGGLCPPSYAFSILLKCEGDSCEGMQLYFDISGASGCFTNADAGCTCSPFSATFTCTGGSETWVITITA